MAKYDEKPEVTLLDMWGSPFVMRVRVALALKGVDYEKREENLPYNKSSLLLQMNPVYQKIPVLIHKGRPICESLIILRYIDEVYNNGWKIWRGKCQDEEEKKAAKEELMEGLKQLEEELGEKLFFGGMNWDLWMLFYPSLLVGSTPMRSMEAWRWRRRGQKIMGWVKRCMTKPSFYITIPNPNKLYEALVEFRSLENLNAKKGGE